MTQKGYMSDFYKQFEEVNKKLDKANNTIFNMSLTISELNENNKNLLKELEESNKKNQELLLEIERLKNNNNKDSSNSSKPSSTNGFKKIITNNRNKSTKKQGGQPQHKGKTLTNEKIVEMINNNEIDEIITVEENKTEENKNLTPIIKYEYDIKIKRIVTKHIIYPDTKKNITKYPVTYGNSIKILNCILSQKYMSLDGIQNFIYDTTNNSINRYEIEFGDFKGKYKLYANYLKEQTMTSINRKYTMDILLKGTYFDTLTGDTYVYVGLKKDKAKQERTDYKDKFISPSILQWESENNVTIDNSIGIKLKNTKNVYVFVRKMDNEDNIILPFTYFGTGKFTNMRESNVKDQKTGATYKTLLFDIKLDNIVPEEYFVDFEIPNE